MKAALDDPAYHAGLERFDREFDLFVDDEPLHLPTARLSEYERAVDFRTGTLDRDLVWETPGGKHVRVRSRRLVSLE